MGRTHWLYISILLFTSQAVYAGEDVLPRAFGYALGALQESPSIRQAMDTSLADHAEKAKTVMETTLSDGQVVCQPAASDPRLRRIHLRMIEAQGGKATLVTDTKGHLIFEVQGGQLPLTAGASSSVSTSSRGGTSTPTRTELRNISSLPSSLIYDQGALGSCTANAAAQIMRYLSVTNSAQPTNFTASNPSLLSPHRDAIYWNTRWYENLLTTGQNRAPTQDTGATLAGTLLALDKYGCGPEGGSTLVEERIPDVEINGSNATDTFRWTSSSYSAVLSGANKQPDPEFYRRSFDPSYTGLNPGTPWVNTATGPTNPYPIVAQKLNYLDIAQPWFNTTFTPSQQTAVQTRITQALAANHPVYFGTSLYASFESNTVQNTGFVPMPTLSEQLLGGHAMMIVGVGPYKTNSNDIYYKVLNSWGNSFGDRGYVYFPAAYIGNIARFYISLFEVWFNA